MDLLHLWLKAITLMVSITFMVNFCYLMVDITFMVFITFMGDTPLTVFCGYSTSLAVVFSCSNSLAV